MFYIDNPKHGGGPKWKNVRIRQTFDDLTGYMIEYKVVHPGGNHHMKRLPMGVTHIKIFFRYEDIKSKSKGKYPNKISHNDKNKRKKKGKGEKI